MKKIICALLLTLGISAVLAQEGKPVASAMAGSATLPLEDFIKRAEFQEMRISPGGESIAVTVPMEDNKTILVVLDRATLKPTAAPPIRGDEMVSDFWWVNNTRLVVTLATKLGGIDTPQPTGELYAINADGTNPMALFGVRAAGTKGTRIKHAEARLASAEVIGLLPGNNKELLIAVYEGDSKEGAFPSIERLDIYTGKTVKIGAAPTRRAQFLADHAGAVRVAYSESTEQSFQFWFRQNATDAWMLVNDEKVSGLRMQPLMFARDNTHVYAQISESDGPDSLYRIEPKSGVKERIYRGAADPLQLLRTADRQDAYAVITADGRLGTEVFDKEAREGKLSRALAANFKDELAYFSSYTRDGRYAIVTVYGDRNPGDFYLFDLDKKSMTLLASRAKWIDPQQMAAMQPIHFNARDGREIHGYLTLPKNSTGKNLPLVVNPHGGPHGVRDVWGYNPEVQLLASRGFAVLQVNYRGSGGYGKTFLEAGYREWGGKMQDDLTDATLWAIQEGYADKNRLCMYGGSYGGYATLEGLVREPNLYKCGIGYAGVYDLRMMYSRGDIQQSLLGEKFLEMVLGSDRDALYAHSPVSQLDKLKAALLIVHGGQDKRVPIAQANALKRLLDERHYPYQWLVEDGEGHGFYKQEHRQKMYQQLLAFLQKNIGANTDVATTEARPR